MAQPSSKKRYALKNGRWSRGGIGCMVRGVGEVFRIERPNGPALVAKGIHNIISSKID